MEAMKMEHVVAGGVRRASCAGSRSRRATPSSRATCWRCSSRPTSGERRRGRRRRRSISITSAPTSPRRSTRHTVGLDAARPDAVARRRATGQRTARENVDDLCDPGTFVEYGALVLAAQRQRRTVEDLIAKTPADGLVAGIGAVNGATVPTDRASCGRARLRLHRARRHAGGAEPPQEGPHARDRRAPAPAGRALHRGRRRPSRRHRRARRRRARRPDVPGVRAAVGSGAAGRHQLGLLLRRQRRAARLLRRRHRDRQLQHRHGRPGDDRGRRARRLSARGDRPDGGADAERRRRRRGRRRGRGGARREAVPRLLPGRGARRGRAPTSAACARSSRRTACASTTCAGS